MRDVGRTRQKGEWTSVTWQQIGELADAVGRGSAPGGRHWRDEATKPGSVAQWRLLYELLWYLGYKELAVIDGLDNNHVAAYENLIETVETIDALLESAARQASPLLPMGPAKNGVADVWEDFEVPQGGWLSRVIAFSPVAQLVVSDRVRWSYRGNNQPAFGAGYAMQEGASRLLERHSGWLATLDERGFGFEVWDGWLCIFKTKLMSELTTGTGSLADQAKLLGGWASEAIIELGELDPGPLKAGQRGKGR